MKQASRCECGRELDYTATPSLQPEKRVCACGRVHYVDGAPCGHCKHNHFAVSEGPCWNCIHAHPVTDNFESVSCTTKLVLRRGTMTLRNIIGACIMLGVMAAGLVYYAVKLVVWAIGKRRKK